MIPRAEQPDDSTFTLTVYSAVLTVRIIPCLDVKDGRVVKGTQFVDLVDAGDPAELAHEYDKEGADEIVFLDITASSDKRNILIDVVRRTAEVLFIPLTVGGGIRSVDDMRDLLKAGADKVSINTSAVENPDLISKGAEQFGRQCMVVAIDAKRAEPSKTVKWEVYTHGGRTPTGKDAVEWAREAERRGAGEILLTSMDRDGTREGYDVELTQAISKAVKIPVIASGGVGSMEDVLNGFTQGKAQAALLASVLHFRLMRIREIKEFLQQRGIPVRI